MVSLAGSVSIFRGLFSCGVPTFVFISVFSDPVLLIIFCLITYYVLLTLAHPYDLVLVPSLPLVRHSKLVDPRTIGFDSLCCLFLFLSFRVVGCLSGLSPGS